MGDQSLVRRGTQVLVADPARVITKLFLPGQETLARGISRADAVIQRVQAMTDEEVAETLADVVESFADRHRDLSVTLAEHFQLVAHRLPDGAVRTAERRELIGAYFTQEYSVEAAALFNPSMVAHPDQSGLGAGEVRFILSLRAVGEGHVSSVEFRTGVIGASDRLTVDDPGRQLVTGTSTPAAMTVDYLRDALAERKDAPSAEQVLSLLPTSFTPAQLEAALGSITRQHLTRGSAAAIIAQIRWIASCNYQVTFPGDHALSECVLYPISADEGHGIEDVRLTRFLSPDAAPTYYGTYTAFDGSGVTPHLLRTDDFRSFESARLVGPASKNKGMALFPRRVNGRYLALSRWDRESIAVASSSDCLYWGDAVTVQVPERPWELIQLGNCGPPIETSEGWLVLTHGVGPMRAYGIGATLLDLDDPTRMIGTLDGPLLMPSEDERNGYVPNVVYSCGGLRHGSTLVLPYGCSDAAVRFAFIDLPGLLSQLTASPIQRQRRPG
ncbi:MAG: hypothetical protein QOH56_1763 [Pseudonocardiales bacterium]|jgi:predicted GH43/DUF377 family glycosyl hydrolase|nr:hypothetical protein [Pseudonocardiales bacterium]